MYVVVKKDNLKLAIAIAQRALPKVIIQEERGHLLFRVVDQKLIISGTNNDYRAHTEIPVSEADGEGVFTLDPKILQKVLPKIESDDIRIELNVTELTLKIYTSEDKRSFTSAQSFPPDKMLTVSGESEPENLYVVNKKTLLTAINYAACYLPDEKEETKFFDQMVIDKGIVYAANGSNKMGFFVCKAFQEIKGLKLRKTFVNLLGKVLTVIPEDDVNLYQTDRTVGISTDNMFFSCLKSNAEAPDIPVEHLKSQGPYNMINKALLLKRMERIVAPNPKKVGAGIELKLEGSEGDAYIDLKLIASLDSNERISCVRVNDQSEKHKHVVGYSLMKAILSSLKAEEDVRLHINDDNKFFKVYEKGKLEGEDYIAAGLGSYSKVIREPTA